MDRCPHCLRTNIVRYKTYLWRCLDCGQIFTTPQSLAPAPDDAATTEPAPTAAPSGEET